MNSQNDNDVPSVRFQLFKEFAPRLGKEKKIINSEKLIAYLLCQENQTADNSNIIENIFGRSDRKYNVLTSTFDDIKKKTKKFF